MINLDITIVDKNILIVTIKITQSEVERKIAKSDKAEKPEEADCQNKNLKVMQWCFQRQSLDVMLSIPVSSVI